MRTQRLGLVVMAILLLVSVAWAANITLQWDPNSAIEQITGYSVYQSLDNVTWTKIADVTGTTHVIPGLTPGRYSWRVTASNAWGESGPSNVVSTPPGLPSAPNNIKLVIAAIAGGLVMLGLLISGLFRRK